MAHGKSHIFNQPVNPGIIQFTNTLYNRHRLRLFNRQIQQSWQDLCVPDAGTDGVARCLVMESALLAGFSKILAEKLLRLWEADPSAVLAAEHPHDFTD